MLIAIRRIHVLTEVNGRLPDAVHFARCPNVVAAKAARPGRSPEGLVPIRAKEKTVVLERAVEGRAQILGRLPHTADVLAVPDVGPPMAPRAVAAHEIELLPVQGDYGLHIEGIGQADHAGGDDLRRRPASLLQRSDEARDADIVAAGAWTHLAVEIHRPTVGGK